GVAESNVIGRFLTASVSTVDGSKEAVMKRTASSSNGWLAALVVVTVAAASLVWAQDQAAGAGASAEVVSAADTSVVLGSASFAELADGGVVMTLDIAANDVIAGGP